MRALSSRALHERIPNLLYVRASVERLPVELAGVADHLSVVLPWGSLLAAMARPATDVLREIRTLCQPGARLEVLLGVDPVRDRAELARLGLASLIHTGIAPALAAGYAQAGFRLETVRSVDPSAWPSTWARRLSHARGRTLVLVTAAATAHGPQTVSRFAPYNG